MPDVRKVYRPAKDLLIGLKDNSRVLLADQRRQRLETEEILLRLRIQPGVILADEVGMGKTFVALSVAYSVAMHDRRAPVVVMVPSNLIEKWRRDLDVFCDLYLKNKKAVDVNSSPSYKDSRKMDILRYGTAIHSVEFLRLFDDERSRRCHIVLLAYGAMSRGLNDHWVRLALIRETLRRYGRRDRIKKVKSQIHRFLGELLWVKFRQNRPFT